MNDAERLLLDLSTLTAGQQAWFALDGPRLFVGDAVSDPEARAFEEALLHAEPLSPDAHLGTGAYDLKGRLHLRAPTLSSSDLDALADRARAEGLDALAGLVLERIDGEGETVRTIEDPTRWAGLSAPVRRGSAADLGAQLTALAPGATARMWATDAGPDGRAFAVVTPTEGDEDGVVDRRVRQGAKALCGGAAGRRAVLQRLSSGALVVSTSGDAPALAATLLAVAKGWGPRVAGVWALAGARVVTPSDDGFDGAARVTPAADLGATPKVLSAIQGTDRTAAAWFTTAGDDGLPHLLLGKRPDDLEAAIAARSGAGATARGALRWVDGTPVLRATAPARLLEHLAGWVALHRPDHPGLAALSGLALWRTDADGQVVERVVRPDLWP